MVPQARQICPQRQELCAIGIGYGWRLYVARSAKLIFKTRDFREPFIPPLFEGRGNQDYPVDRPHNFADAREPLRSAPVPAPARFAAAAPCRRAHDRRLLAARHQARAEQSATIPPLTLL